VTVKKVDGRQQRSERRRQQIIDAMIRLINEGVYIPTAQQVADVAEISIRTVFRHFSEMDLLYVEIDEATKPSYQRHFSDQDFSGTFESRTQRAVDARVHTYIETLCLQKAAHSLFWRSKLIRDLYQANQDLLKKNLFNMLPELKGVGLETQETVVGVTSFEFFERLQVHQGLSEDACKVLILNLVRSLLSEK
jgi:AcrR family transcriptional regulator